jgi:hypothetical protein
MTPEWRKSSHSGTGGAQSDCVEVAALPHTIGLRDSKTPTRGHLALTRDQFAGLVGRIKHQER